MPMVEAERLRKDFGEVSAVADLSFSVDAGEIFGLLGPNGAGKTTTVRMLTGLLRPTGGRAVIAGLDTVRERRRMLSAVGVSFELPALYPRLSVQENLEFAASLRRASRADVAQAVERLGLGAYRRRSVRSLSKGWRQRTMIARAMLGGPQVLFLDEPTSGLDPNASADLHEVLRSLRDDGVTILLTTHDMVEAAELCDRVAILRSGRLAALDSPASLVERLQGRSVRVTWWESGALREDAAPLGDPATPGMLERVLTQHRVLEIATTGSPDDVYRRLTGGKEG